MNEFKRVFLDTAPVIYYVQKNEVYFDKVKCLVDRLNESGAKFVLSDITTAEACVYPYRFGRLDWLNNYDRFLERFFVDIIHTTDEIARKSAMIRAKYQGFKTMDSMQLAAAVVGDCDLFLTNDKRLCRFDEIECQTVDDF